MYVHFYFAVDFCHSVTDIELLTVSVCPPKPTLKFLIALYVPTSLCRYHSVSSTGGHVHCTSPYCTNSPPHHQTPCQAVDRGSQ